MASPAKWIGVDFDETLRRYDDTPIEAMVERVKRWLAEGRVVKIVTARMYEPRRREFDSEQDFIDAANKNWEWRNANGGGTVEDQIRFVQDWCEKYIGVRLHVRYGKGPGMICLYDDKTVGVEPNTGTLLSRCLVDCVNVLSAQESQVVVNTDYEGGELRHASRLAPINPGRLDELRRAIFCKMKWFDASHGQELLDEVDRLTAIIKAALGIEEVR